MTGSMAARRRISRRMALVTRRTWPLIQTLNIGDDGAESVAIIWVAVQRLGMKHELPALGRGDRQGG